MRINGIGITLLGIAGDDGPDESTATLWFTFAFLPVIPIRRMRVKFLSHKGSGFSYQFIANEKLVLSEILRTYLYCWILVPALGLAPFLLGNDKIWTALSIPKSLQIPYLALCAIWAVVYIWKVADRHEARCRPKADQ
jgi:hypothetical protein